MMRFLNSRFAQWLDDHQSEPPLEHDSALRSEALNALVESINTGEITSLDGVESPLSKQISALHGLSHFEMNSNWICSSQEWICPCCARSKLQISRKGKKGQILAKLVIHHDHMGEAMEVAFNSAFENAGTDVAQVDGRRLIERMGRAFAAHEEVLICEDCNNADAEAKKRVSAPQYFSFSPGQISQFISAREHQPHEVQELEAERVWRQAKPAYELRMKLIREIAHAAATDAHWYEPHARGAYAIPLLGSRYESGDIAIQQWVSTDPLIAALGPKKPISTPNRSRWRTEPPKKGKPLPNNFIAMLRSEEAHARRWDSTPEDWHCPICNRSKSDTAYLNERGKVIFHLHEISKRYQWGAVGMICNHCTATFKSLKEEAAGLAGIDLYDAYGFVQPEELAEIIIAHPHSPHQVQAEKAADLVTTSVKRLSDQI